MKKLIGIIGILAIFACAFPALAHDSAFSNATTNACCTFGPGNGQTVVQSVYAATDLTNGAVKFYARSGNKYIPTSNSVVTTNCVWITNTSTNIATSDRIVYAYAGGLVLNTTVTNATSTNIWMAANMSIAGSAGDAVYKLSQQGQIQVGTKSASVGTNDTLNTAGQVFSTPGDSPLYVTCNGTSNCTLQVTVEK